MENVSTATATGAQPLRPLVPSSITSSVSTFENSHDGSDLKASSSFTEFSVDDDVGNNGIDSNSSTKPPPVEPHRMRYNQDELRGSFSQSDSAAFTYERLDPVRKEIRLLHIKNLMPDGLIECVLTHVSLMDQPTYRALSYCWGEESPKKQILLNGFLIDIRANLYSALWHIASNGNHTVWVDALSINQDDLGERADQIQCMKYIYHKAETVLAWLGDADENTSAALNLVGRLATRMIGIGSNVLPKEVFHLIFDSSMNANDWKPLEALFQKEYWSRVWIIQELAVARHCFIIWGDQAITWESVSSAISTCREYLDACERPRINQPFDLPSYLPSDAVGYRTNPNLPPGSIAWSGAESNAPREQGNQITQNNYTSLIQKPDLSDLRRLLSQCDSIMGLDRFRADFISGRAIDFIEALMRSSKSRGSDIRDKAISLLGLTHNGFDFIPLPNYTQSPDDLSIEITAVLMKKLNSLRFLSYFWNHRRPAKYPVPSWSIEWLNLQSYSFVDQDLRLLLTGEEQKNIYFRGNTIIQRYFVNRTKPRLVISGRTLELRGKWIGTISDISKTLAEVLEEATCVEVQENSQTSGSDMDDACSEKSSSLEPDVHGERSGSSASFHSARSMQPDRDTIDGIQGPPKQSPNTGETESSSEKPSTSARNDSLEVEGLEIQAEPGDEVEEDTDDSSTDEIEDADADNPYLDITEATKALLQAFTIYADLPLKEKIDSLTEHQYTTSTARIDLKELVDHESAIWLKELSSFEFQDCPFWLWLEHPQYFYLNNHKERTSGLFTRKIRVGGSWEPRVDRSIIVRIREELQKVLDRGVRLISTAQGYIGWGHPDAKVDDKIWLLSGNPVPIILRPVPGGYVIVGDVYLYGVLDGRATEALVEEDLDTIKIF